MPGRMVPFLWLCMVCAVMAIWPSAAHASFWLVCRVTATVVPAEEDGIYHITPHEAVVSDGHVKKGEPCLQGRIGETLSAPIQGGNVPTGTRVKLGYSYYNGMTADGVVNVETWSAP